MKELHVCVCAWVWVWKGCGRGGEEVVVMEGQNQNAIKATQHNKSTHTTHETTYDTI